jgi:hypothetical protein
MSEELAEVAESLLFIVLRELRVLPQVRDVTVAAS